MSFALASFVQFDYTFPLKKIVKFVYTFVVVIVFYWPLFACILKTAAQPKRSIKWRFLRGL